jgi:hypothetical protein
MRVDLRHFLRFKRTASEKIRAAAKKLLAREILRVLLNER